MTATDRTAIIAEFSILSEETGEAIAIVSAGKNKPGSVRVFIRDYDFNEVPIEIAAEDVDAVVATMKLARRFALNEGVNDSD